MDGFNFTATSSNPLAGPLDGVAQSLPNWLKLDALAQTAVLWWYLTVFRHPVL